MDFKELEQKILDNGFEDVILYSDPDYADAFVGITQDNRAVYSFNKMVKHLVEKDNMTESEACEFIDYNTLGAYISDLQPIVVFTLD